MPQALGRGGQCAVGCLVRRLWPWLPSLRPGRYLCSLAPMPLSRAGACHGGCWEVRVWCVHVSAGETSICGWYSLWTLGCVPPPRLAPPRVQLCPAPRGPGVPAQQLARSGGHTACPLVDPAVTSGSSPAQLGDRESCGVQGEARRGECLPKAPQPPGAAPALRTGARGLGRRIGCVRGRRAAAAGLSPPERQVSRGLIRRPLAAGGGRRQRGKRRPAASGRCGGGPPPGAGLGGRGRQPLGRREAHGPQHCCPHPGRLREQAAHATSAGNAATVALPLRSAFLWNWH